jgi:hypothetical protein
MADSKFAKEQLAEVWTAPSFKSPMRPSQWVIDAISEIARQMEDIKTRAMKPDANIILLRDECKDLLKSKGLCMKKFMNSRWVGVHPSNRYGDGVLPADCLALIADIFGQGFSALQLQDPTLVGVPPMGHPRRDHFVGRNQEMVQGSGGQLPAFDDPIDGVSVTCGHTSMGMRCWLFASPSDDSRFTEDGRLSLRRLKELQPAYHKAVVEGIEWDFIEWAVEDAWPWVPALLQEAGNATQQISRAENRMQIMQKIVEIARRNMRLHGDPQWNRVQMDATRGGSPFKEEVVGLITYVKELSGGLEEPTLLNELRDFVKQLGSVRTVKGYMLAAAADMRVGTEGACAIFRMAIAKAMFSCSAQYTKGDSQALFRSEQLTAMTRGTDKQKIVRDADAFLVDVRKLADANHLQEPMRTTMVGLVDCQVVHHVANKVDAARGTFRDLGAIGSAFAKDLANAIGAPVQSKWNTEPSQAPPAHRCTSVASDVKTFSAQGAWTNSRDALSAKEFEVGKKIKHPKTLIVFKIVDISDRDVTLRLAYKDDDNDDTHVLHDEFLKEAYVFAEADKDSMCV